MNHASRSWSGRSDGRSRPKRAVGPAGAKRRRYAVLAILALALGYAAVVADVGWNQGAHYALIRALYRGDARIDDDRWLTGDVSYRDGHFYSIKAPGLALVSMPAYAAMRTAGLDAAISRHSSSRRAAAQKMIWLVGLWSVVIPAGLLLVLVYRLADWVEPGFGAAAAVSLGTATLALPFATLFFAHVLSALLGFAAFVLLWRARDGPRKLRLVGAAGVLAGLAATTEYSLVLVGFVLGLYALARAANRLARGVVYAVSFVLGVVPVLLYNQWAFGSLSAVSYEDAVRIPGATGHDVLGANSSGFFGIGVPSPRAALELLFAGRGLLTIGPVIVMGVVGTVMLYRQGRRAEAFVVGAVAVSFFLFNSSYYLPFGGWGSGPRFLIPALPFLAFPLALAYRRLPATTLGLAVASAVMLISATATQPGVPNTADTSIWADRIRAGRFQETIALFLGVRDGWLAIAPFVACLLIALIFAVRATPHIVFLRPDVVRALILLVTWALAASLVPHLGASPGNGAAVLVACAAAIAGGAVCLAALHRGSHRAKTARRVSTAIPVE